MDLTSMAEAFSMPGIDPRLWVSMATVEPGEKSIIFTDDDGNPSPIGPTVVVQLHPSGVVIPCRVASSCAGVSEGEWMPFLPGDEVIVAIPHGTERAGGVILGRLNQSIDVFPLTVAGQDVTKNVFGFKRLRTPYILETASSFMIRSAVTGAGLTIDQTGNAYFVSGDGHKLVLHGSFIKLEAKDGETFIQIDPGSSDVLIQAGGTTQFLLSSDTCTFFTQGSLDIGTGGAPGLGHAVTIEQVIGLLINWTIFLGQQSTTLGGELAMPGKVFFPATYPSVLDAALSALLLAAGSPAPPLPPATYGGNFLALPLTFGPAGAIKAAMLANPIPDLTGMIPGIGRANLKL